VLCDTPYMSQIRAVVGARVSHMSEEKASHISQRSKGEAYAESQNWTVVGAFEDLDVSAIKWSPWDRPDLKKWLTDQADDWDALIFAKTDRVFRSANDCVKLAEWCREHHKILVLVDDGIRLDYFNPEDAKDAFAGAMSKVFLILASVFAEIEGQRFVQRARDRVADFRNTDRWAYGLPPFGFQIVDHPAGVGKALDHDTEAQKVLHDIANRFLDGGSMSGIVNYLNNAGVPSPADWHRQRSGKPVEGTRWAIDVLRMMLTNPTTQGIKTAAPDRTAQRKRPIGKPILDAEGEPVRVGPASFKPEVWEQLQRELSQRKAEPQTRRHSTNPLLGVAKCGCMGCSACEGTMRRSGATSCGKNMRQRSQTTPRTHADPRCGPEGEHVADCECRGGVTHRYYVCGASPSGCSRVSITSDSAEELVADAFLHHHADRKVRERIWQPGSDRSAELDETNRRIESLREDRAIGLYPTPEDEQVYRQQMKAQIAKRDELAALPIVRAGWVEEETDQTYGEVWPTATPEKKRKMATDAGVVLTVYPRGIPGMSAYGGPLTDTYSDLDKLLGDGTPVEPVELPTDPESDARIAAQKKKRAAKDPAKTG
jgi:site-specific DNA recombinase